MLKEPSQLSSFLVLCRGAAIRQTPKIVVVQNHTHGLANNAEDAPEECIANKRIVKPLINNLGENDERSLTKHTQEGM